MIRDQLFTGDCLEHLQEIPPASIDLVFADLPFNIGYAYDIYNDQRGRTEYLRWCDLWLKAIQKILKPTGSFFLAIGDEFAAEFKVRLDQLGLCMRNWIIWHYTFGVNCQRKFNRSHAHILYYTMNAKHFTFNADAIRVPSARQTTYGDRRANPRGKLPDDTWVLRPQEDHQFFQPTDDTWYVPRVCGTFKERRKNEQTSSETAQTAHPCQMPEAILERIIRIATNSGDYVLDPFAGSGTTLAVAKRLGRHYIGIELSPNYCKIIENRLTKRHPPGSPGRIVDQLRG